MGITIVKPVTSKLVYSCLMDKDENFIIDGETPGEIPQAKNRLDEVEDSWYKEMFYFMCLTGVRVGELGGLK